MIAMRHCAAVRGMQHLPRRILILDPTMKWQATFCRWHASQAEPAARSLKRKPSQDTGSPKQSTPGPATEKHRTSIFFMGQPVYPSERVKHFAREHDISLAGPPRGISIQYPLDMIRLPLSVMASREHTFNDIHWKYLDYTTHPFSETMLDHYVRKKREESLWVWILIPPSSAVPYVRSRARTRLVGALTLALAQRGYDAVGRRIVPGTVGKFQKRWCVDEEGEPIVAKTPQLKGTIKLLCKASPIIHTSFDDVLRQMNIVVMHLEEYLGTDARQRRGGGGEDVAGESVAGDLRGRSSKSSSSSRDTRDQRDRGDKKGRNDDANSGGRNWVQRGLRDGPRRDRQHHDLSAGERPKPAWI